MPPRRRSPSTCLVPRRDGGRPRGAPARAPVARRAIPVGWSARARRARGLGHDLRVAIRPRLPGWRGATTSGFRFGRGPSSDSRRSAPRPMVTLGAPRLPRRHFGATNRHGAPLPPPPARGAVLGLRVIAGGGAPGATVRPPLRGFVRRQIRARLPAPRQARLRRARPGRRARIASRRRCPTPLGLRARALRPTNRRDAMRRCCRFGACMSRAMPKFGATATACPNQLLPSPQERPLQISFQAGDGRFKSIALIEHFLDPLYCEMRFSGSYLSRNRCIEFIPASTLYVFVNSK